MVEKVSEMKAGILRQNELIARYKKARVLIVEDNAEARGILRAFMREFGAEKMDLVISGQEAIDHLAVRAYDIILCDYNLGKGKDGQQVLEEARCSKYLSYSSIFMMITAETTVEMVMGALEYQPDGYITKPYTRNDLKERLNRVLTSKIEYRAIEQQFENHHYAEAIKLCDEKIEADSEPPMRAYRIKAECLVKQREYKPARTLYEDVLKDREIPWAIIGLGKALYFLREFDESAKIFSRLIKEQPNVIESYDWLAKIHIQLKKTGEAQRIIQRAVERSPKAVIRQMELARIAIMNHSYLIAEKALRNSIKLAKNSCYNTPNNYLMYVRTLLVKIDSSSNPVCVAAFGESKLFLSRMNKEFGKDEETQFRGNMLEALVDHMHGNTRDSERALKAANSLFCRFTIDVRTKLADEYVNNLALMGRIDDCNHFIHQLQKESDNPELANRLITRVEDAKRRLHSERLSNEAMELYRHGQMIEAHARFAEAASTSGATANVLLDAVGVCIELAEREDLNRDQWRKDCEAFLERLKRLDRYDHRFEIYMDYKMRFNNLK